MAVRDPFQSLESEKESLSSDMEPVGSQHTEWRYVVFDRCQRPGASRSEGPQGKSPLSAFEEYQRCVSVAAILAMTTANLRSR